MTQIIDSRGQIGSRVYANTGALPPVRIGALIFVDGGTNGQLYVGVHNAGGTPVWFAIGGAGAVGSQGPQGVQGVQGVRGADGLGASLTVGAVTNTADPTTLSLTAQPLPVGATVVNYVLAGNLQDIDSTTYTPPAPPAGVSICDVSEAISLATESYFQDFINAFINQTTLNSNLGAIAAGVVSAVPTIGALGATLITALDGMVAATATNINSEFTTDAKTKIREKLYCTMNTANTKLYTDAIQSSWADAIGTLTYPPVYADFAPVFANFVRSLDVRKMAVIGSYAAAGSGNCAAYDCPSPFGTAWDVTYHLATDYATVTNLPAATGEYSVDATGYIHTAAPDGSAAIGIFAFIPHGGDNTTRITKIEVIYGWTQHSPDYQAIFGDDNYADVGFTDTSHAGTTGVFTRTVSGLSMNLPAQRDAGQYFRLQVIPGASDSRYSPPYQNHQVARINSIRIGGTGTPCDHSF